MRGRIDARPGRFRASLQFLRGRTGAEAGEGNALKNCHRLERAMGFEPTTFCLGSKHSTTELRPLIDQCYFQCIKRPTTGSTTSTQPHRTIAKSFHTVEYAPNPSFPRKRESTVPTLESCHNRADGANRTTLQSSCPAPQGLSILWTKTKVCFQASDLPSFPRRRESRGGDLRCPGTLAGC